jgi:uncharacterized repeat protein (TIGR01451 family)
MIGTTHARRTCLLMAALMVTASVARAQVTISDPVVDTTTGGDWRNGPYGSCYHVTPQQPNFIKLPPDRAGTSLLKSFPVNPDYRVLDQNSQTFVDAQCVGGPGQASFDFQTYTLHGGFATPPGASLYDAFIWKFCNEFVHGDPASIVCGQGGQWNLASNAVMQFNQCSGTFQNATWHSDVGSYEGRFVYDPLGLTLQLQTGGNARIAYYFLQGSTECRSQSWTLTVKNASGTILAHKASATPLTNFNHGTYLVFDVANLPEGSDLPLYVTFQTQAVNLAQCPSSNNSHLSGVYVSGTNACARPAQLAVTKVPKGRGFTLGSQIRFDIVVSNPALWGAGTATNVKLTDQLPGNGGLVWQSARSTQGSCTVVDNVLNCSLLDIAPQAQVTVTVVSTPTTPAAACQLQQNPVALATADGGLSAEDSASLNCAPPATGVPPAR